MTFEQEYQQLKERFKRLNQEHAELILAVEQIMNKNES